jgi:hypothetical protein
MAAQTGKGAGVPPITRSILTRWAAGDLGALTGFTGALVRNDLAGAVALADAANLAALSTTLEWMADALPADCWGSVDTVRAWGDRHRLHDWWKEPGGMVCDGCGSAWSEVAAGAGCPGPSEGGEA